MLARREVGGKGHPGVTVDYACNEVLRLAVNQELEDAVDCSTVLALDCAILEGHRVSFGVLEYLVV